MLGITAVLSSLPARRRLPSPRPTPSTLDSLRLLPADVVLHLLHRLIDCKARRALAGREFLERREEFARRRGGLLAPRRLLAHLFHHLVEVEARGLLPWGKLLEAG